MSRVMLSMPDNVVFTHRLSVRIYDINHGQHLGHDRLISLLHEARNAFFQSMGYEELDIDGIGIVVADLEVSYKGEAFAGDMIRIDLSLDELKDKSMSMYYRVVVDEDQRLIAQARTGIVFFDYGARQVAQMPASFRQRFDGSRRVNEATVE